MRPVRLDGGCNDITGSSGEEEEGDEGGGDERYVLVLAQGCAGRLGGRERVAGEPIGF